MTKIVLLLALAFGVALAIVVGLRLERASLAVLVGVICGIAAGLPISGALLYLLWRERQQQRQQEERQWRAPGQGANPPVIILNSGRGADMAPPYRHPALVAEQGEREFNIVGEE